MCHPYTPFLFSFHAQYTVQLKSAPRGSDEMNKLSDLIASGARSFLKTEYFYLSFFVAVFFVFLVALYSADPPTAANDRLDGIRMGGCFLAGAGLSALAGWGGMAVATDANVRTTQAADKEGLNAALKVAFTGGGESQRGAKKRPGNMLFPLVFRLC